MPKENDVSKTLIMKSCNIAFYKVQKGDIILLYTVDLNNKKHIARFKYERSKQKFIMVSSTFPESERKYDMLFLLERNLEEIREVFLNA